MVVTRAPAFLQEAFEISAIYQPSPFLALAFQRAGEYKPVCFAVRELQLRGRGDQVDLLR